MVSNMHFVSARINTVAILEEGLVSTNENPHNAGIPGVMRICFVVV